MDPGGGGENREGDATTDDDDDGRINIGSHQKIILENTWWGYILYISLTE